MVLTGISRLFVVVVVFFFSPDSVEEQCCFRQLVYEMIDGFSKEAEV